MLSCKEVCSLTSESLDKDLSLFTRISIRTHLFICKGCRNMVKQMKLLHHVASQLGSTDGSDSKQTGKLSDDARSRILENVQQYKHGSAEDK